MMKGSGPCHTILVSHCLFRSKEVRFPEWNLQKLAKMADSRCWKTFSSCCVLLIVVSLTYSLPPPSEARRLHVNEAAPVQNRVSEGGRTFADLFMNMMGGMMNGSWGNLMMKDKNAQISFVPLGSIFFSKTTEAPLRKNIS